MGIPKDLPNDKVVIVAIIFLIVSGSVALTFVPEVLSTQCLTPDHQWIENGTRQVGFMVNCP